MSKLDWKKESLSRKPKRSLGDEKDWMGADRAARWLAKRDGSSSKSRSVERSSGVLRSDCKTLSPQAARLTRDGTDELIRKNPKIDTNCR